MVSTPADYCINQLPSPKGSWFFFACKKETCRAKKVFQKNKKNFELFPEAVVLDYAGGKLSALLVCLVLAYTGSLTFPNNRLSSPATSPLW
ncbi:hypothetical protein GZ77_22520 [Endozoicomonas montiporae]|uniref:Uncharacterized protein n=1 Tax=Endozoicomonas montiporae TaxID=1027273 RepID=A0A081N0C4_9GAMM|nr:hypothetical protein GZ77_22520 [Endozoicomonas montiporae]